MSTRNRKSRYSLADVMPELLSESADAQILYKAMKGMGTDEEAIEDVFARRANDLRALSNEYMQYAASKGESDTDLASWLEDDGMDNQAAVLRATPLVTSAPTTSGAASGAAPAAAAATTTTTAAAPAAGALKPVTAPEVNTLLQLGDGAKQDPVTKQWTMKDGRVTKPIAEAPLSRGALIRKRYGRY